MSNITFAPFPIPVVVDGLGDCIIVSQTDSGSFEDDIWTISICNGGQMAHVRTSQMKMYHNATLGIKKNQEWSDEKLVEWAAFYSKQENHLDPKTILEKFKNRNK